MDTFSENNQLPVESSENSRLLSSTEVFINPRRAFIKKTIFLGTITGAAGLGLTTSCKEKEEETEEEISPAEDLMREHGLLNRILLIYDTCRLHLSNNEKFDLAALYNSAQIIRTFVEDYHEKLEENYLFPRFEKANQLTNLVSTLRAQHIAGRNITNRIIEFGKMKSLAGSYETQQLVQLLDSFNKMYRPHEAREDTVLFPAIRKIISRNEYFALGEDFEKKEHQLFGEEGFETMVERVANIEKQIGIYDLAQFTPEL